MADEKIRFDVAEAMAGISRIIGGLNDVKAQALDTGKAIDSAFDTGAAEGVADALNELEKEYAQLKRSADTLKGALKSATDPTLIKTYATSIAQLEAGMKKLEKAGAAAGVNLKTVSKEASTATDVFEGFFGAMTKATIILAVIDGVRKLTSYAIGLSENIEKSKRQFEAFTGSAAEADKIVKKLIAIGKADFLGSAEILQAGKSLLAFGESANDLPEVLDRLANISAATGKNFNELTLIYGKARAAGVLYAEDINQLVDAGIPIIQEFAKQMGVSNDQVKKLATEGKISFEELQLAMFNLTQKGGKFAEQTDVQAKSIADAWSRLTSTVEPILQDFGKRVSDRIQFSLNVLALAAQKITGLFQENKPTIEVDYSGRDAYEKAKDDLYERQRLEEAAEKARLQQSQKSGADLAKMEAEKSRLRIEAMKEGEAQEIAQENLRYTELISQLKKYHIDTEQATEQHNLNIAAIEAKYTAERLLQEKELLDLRKQEALFEAEKNKQNFDKAKANLETVRALRQSEVDILEQQFDNFIDVLEKGGIKKEEVQRQQAEFDDRIREERLKSELEFQKGLLSITSAGDQAAIDLIKNKIALINAELEKLGSTGGGDIGQVSLLERLGLGEKDIEAISQAADSITSIFESIIGAQLDAANAEIEASQKRLDAAQSFYDEQKTLNEQGFANDLDLAQKRLDAAKEQEAKALEQKRQAQRQQLILDTAQQTSSLITASANTLKTFNGPLLPVGIALITAMFAAFVAAKARAVQASKFRHGGEARVDGNSILVGASHEGGGIGIEAEGGEFATSDGKRLSIVNKRMTDKHFDLLAAINKDNKAGMRAALERIVGPHVKRDAVRNVAGESAPPSATTDRKGHKILEQIRDKKQRTHTVEGQYAVTREGNYTRKIRVRK